VQSATDRLAAAFAAAQALEDHHQLGALLQLERLPPSHAISDRRCLGRWAWRARVFRLLGDWVVAEAIEEDPASAILAAVERARGRIEAPWPVDAGVVRALEGMD